MSNLRDFFLQLETSLASGVTLARTLHLLSENRVCAARGLD